MRAVGTTSFGPATTRARGSARSAAAALTGKSSLQRRRHAHWCDRRDRGRRPALPIHLGELQRLHGREIRPSAERPSRRISTSSKRPARHRSPRSTAAPISFDQPDKTITLFHGAPPPVVAGGGSGECVLAQSGSNVFYTDAANVWRAAIGPDGHASGRPPPSRPASLLLRRARSRPTMRLFTGPRPRRRPPSSAAPSPDAPAPPRSWWTRFRR